MEPTTQTSGSSDDYISLQQEDLQLNDEAVRYISTIQMFSLKYQINFVLHIHLSFYRFL
jgi:hypothetical protein